MYEQYAKIRDSRGLTDSEVAEKCGVSQSIFSRWKSGKSSPSRKTRFKISQALGVPYTTDFVGHVDGVDGFVIENKDFNAIGQFSRIAAYAIKLNDGGVIELTPDQLEQLNKAVDAFIRYYCETNFNLNS